jgi:ubiquinone/menaquinone biosynthesis C-methylase UbiE
VGLYREHVLPRLVDRACGTAELRQWREQVTAGLFGTVVEIGFGSGLNMPAYPAEVTLVYAVEPAATARRLAEQRIADSGIRVEHIALRGESIPLEDASCDGALSTFTLCTIAHVEQALAEIQRVIRPGGRFHFLEHGLSPDTTVARWQHRLEPLQKRVADGCHLTRQPDELVRAAGLTIERVESRYATGPKPWTWFTEGVAIKPR